MKVADFSYDSATDPAGFAAGVSVLSNHEAARHEIVGDLKVAGFCPRDGGRLAGLIDGSLAALDDVILLDCPDIGGGEMASLARLDERAAVNGAKLVVVTSLDALDVVFALLDQSSPQILISPSRAEYMLAVGRACGELRDTRLREMSEEERVSLLRLSQQVDAIARSLDRLSVPDPAWQSASAISSGDGLRDARPDFRGAVTAAGSGQHSSSWAGCLDTKPNQAGALQLPDPKLVRQIIANRQRRSRFFDAHLFADPAWDMLLDLTAAHAEGNQVSVTSLCIAAGVPATTALRWLTQMVESGVFRRTADAADKRRVFIELSESALAAMAGYFSSMDETLALAAS